MSDHHNRSSALDKVRAAQNNLFQAIFEYETLVAGEIDYSAWSEAKGSAFAKIFEAKTLDPEILSNCQLLPSRYHLLKRLSKGGYVAEIGTQHGGFTKYIVDLTHPKELHLFDLSFDEFSLPRSEPGNLPKLTFHKGDSSTLLMSCDDSHFDFLYIDGDHSYEGVKRDLFAAQKKVKRDGIIVCNDYTSWSPLEATSYGIPKAIHEFCIEYRWRFKFLALHPWGYHDVALEAAPNPELGEGNP